jgi:hypothetical protein
MLGRRRLLAVAVAAASAACGSGEPARLAVRDLPAETSGVTTRATFELRNDGGRPLVLDRVVPACGCGPVSRLPAELRPGVAAQLEIECVGSSVAGDDVRELALRTSDPRSPETLLRVRLGRAAHGLAPVYLGYVAVGETLVRDVAVPSLAADVAPRSSGDVDVETASGAPDAARAVRVRFRPRTAGVVRATVDLGAAGLLTVTAVGYDGVMAFPAEVRSPRPSGAAGLPPVTLVAAGASPFTVGHVEYPPGMSGEIRPVVPGRQYRLALALRGALAGGAAIRVHGERPEDPVLVIPVVDAADRDRTRPPA